MTVSRVMSDTLSVLISTVSVQFCLIRSCVGDMDKVSKNHRPDFLRATRYTQPSSDWGRGRVDELVSEGFTTTISKKPWQSVARLDVFWHNHWSFRLSSPSLWEFGSNCWSFCYPQWSVCYCLSSVISGENIDVFC